MVVNAGAPVDLPWTASVGAVLQTWFGGEEMAAALADVLTGRTDPGGRLPTTIPVRLEHNPSFDNFPGERGELRYGEGLFMGYRGYEHRQIAPRFAFGHGLSYSTFEFGAPTPSSATWRRGQSITVSVPVTNTGRRAGSEVVQGYVAPRSPKIARPPKELKAFAKLRLGPGQTGVAELELDERSFAYWDPGAPDWERITPPRRGRRLATLGPERAADRWLGGRARSLRPADRPVVTGHRRDRRARRRPGVRRGTGARERWHQHHRYARSRPTASS